MDPGTPKHRFFDRFDTISSSSPSVHFFSGLNNGKLLKMFCSRVDTMHANMLGLISIGNINLTNLNSYLDGRGSQF